MDNKSFGVITGVMGLLCLAIGFYNLTSEDNTLKINKSSKSESLSDFTDSLVNSMAESSRSNMKSVTVPSTVEWYDTKIDVPRGKSYHIRYAGGYWTNVRGTKLVSALGRNGGDRSLMLVPGGYLCQLVGKVGSEIFVTGEEYTGTSANGGRLYLAMNDQVGTYQDNDGELKVYVEVK